MYIHLDDLQKILPLPTNSLAMMSLPSLCVTARCSCGSTSMWVQLYFDFKQICGHAWAVPPAEEPMSIVMGIQKATDQSRQVFFSEKSWSGNAKVPNAGGTREAAVKVTPRQTLCLREASLSRSAMTNRDLTLIKDYVSWKLWMCVIKAIMNCMRCVCIGFTINLQLCWCKSMLDHHKAFWALCKILVTYQGSSGSCLILLDICSTSLKLIKNDWSFCLYSVLKLQGYEQNDPEQLRGVIQTRYDYKMQPLESPYDSATFLSSFPLFSYLGHCCASRGHFQICFAKAFICFLYASKW